MKPLKIFRHVDCEGPGYLGSVLERENIPFTIVCIDLGQDFSIIPDDCSGLIFMGGPMSVNDDLAWISREIELIQAAVARGLPVLGHCLGGQLLAKALGADISPNRVREIGWHTVEKTGYHEFTRNLPESFSAFHWHGESFAVPQGGRQLLRNEHCENQAFSFRNCLGLQCHVEMTEVMVREWITRYAEELHGPSSVQNAASIKKNLSDRCTQLQCVADKLYMNWLRESTR